MDHVLLNLKKGKKHSFTLIFVEFVDQNCIKFGQMIQLQIWSNSESVVKMPFSEASTRFSSITVQKNQLQLFKLFQKILFTILHRLMYNLSRNKIDLKSEIGEIGRFSSKFGRLVNDFSTRFSSIRRERNQLQSCILS